MFLKKVDPNQRPDDKTTCSVLLTPLPNHSQKEALQCLHQLGANHIEEISTGFISADIPRSAVPQLEEVAQVEVKRSYQMR